MPLCPAEAELAIPLTNILIQKVVWLGRKGASVAGRLTQAGQKTGPGLRIDEENLERYQWLKNLILS